MINIGPSEMPDCDILWVREFFDLFSGYVHRVTAGDTGRPPVTVHMLRLTATNSPLA